MIDIIKSLFLCLVVCFCPFTSSPTLASEDDLILGCRPWDGNINNVPGIQSAHFVDFLAPDKPQGFSYPHFHQRDFNDEARIPGAGPFSSFAKEHPEKFASIVFDWATQKHVTRKGFWQDCHSLLKPGGLLVIPTYGFSIFQKAFTSESQADELIQKLDSLFACQKKPAHQLQLEDIQNHKIPFDLLTRIKEQPDYDSILKNGWVVLATRRAA